MEKVAVKRGVKQGFPASRTPASVRIECPRRKAVNHPWAMRFGVKKTPWKNASPGNPKAIVSTDTKGEGALFAV